jgi:competence protein ComFC
MVPINPQRIHGRFQLGMALDFQTTSSTFIGNDESGRPRFDTVRPQIAELLYQLKYHGDLSASHEIADTAAAFIRANQRREFDLIIPVPPTSWRATQPVILVAGEIGVNLGIPVVQCVTTTRQGTQLKNVTDPEKREELLRGLYAVDARHTAGKTILLFDDLFRSGSTMNAITDVLFKEGLAAHVSAIAITRTRRNQ